jgi:hypothetical protein
MCVALAAAPLGAQMTPGQRRADFEQLAGMVAKAYAPYEWKRDAFGVDALRIGGWLDRVLASKDDLEFWEVCAEYIASLRDLHSGFELRSDFAAEIDIFVDLYDGRPVIEFISRSQLPESRYPFQVGDELVSVDGVTPEQWIERVSRLQSFANPSATRRWALDQIFYRLQQSLPRAHEIGDTARVEVKRASTGNVEGYDVAWRKSGTPILSAGPVPSPVRSVAARPAAAELDDGVSRGSGFLQQRRAPGYKRLRGFGRVSPLWTPPPGFAVRLGNSASDPIYSGTYIADGYRIGYLRIPSFPGGSSATFMLRAVESEVLFFRANTDGLVVDVTRNPGGDVCLTNELLRRLINYPFRTVGDEFRPTLEVVQAFRSDYEDYLEYGTDPVVLAYLKAFYDDVYTAYREYRGRTGPLPVCGLTLDLEPARSANGNVIAFDKPLILLIDEFSTSSGDAFAAIMQDAGRGLMVGRQTAGGGGLVNRYLTGVYGESQVSLSITLGVRGKQYQVPGLPPTNYIENVGALPDIEIDYQTVDNLLNGGRTYVDSFTRAIVDQIRRSTAP